MKLGLYVTLSLVFLNLVACEKIAVFMTPVKKPAVSHSKIADRAERYFWTTLHEGRYLDITKADKLLMAAYLKNPNDPNLAAHLGFLHIWKITERQRGAGQDPLIPNEIILSKQYFSDAHVLDPKNAIYQGFLGDSQVVTGQIFHDKREEVRGYFTLKSAIAKWPEFNYFTAGYLMTTLPPQSKQFKKALKWQWKTLDICLGRDIDRKNPQYRLSSVKLVMGSKKYRACWDTWIAPHNVEGYFMNMGDMLVKSGDWQTGIAMYKNATYQQNYAFWPYRSMLEKRIKNAKENVKYFQQDPASADPDRAIMFNSGYGCMACHQQR